jgi:hypothetical protein
VTFVTEEQDGEFWLCTCDENELIRIARFVSEEAMLSFHDVLNLTRLSARECGRQGL